MTNYGDGLLNTLNYLLTLIISPPKRGQFAQIVETLGWEKALNRRSTTWRGLEEAQKADVDNSKAIALIEEHETLLKRPVFVGEGEMVVGFGDDARALVAG